MTGFDLSTITGCYVGSTPASAIYYGSSKIWPATQHDFSQDYLTIVSLEDNNVIGWKLSGTSSRTISVSTDNGSTWTSYTSSTAVTTLATLNSGGKLLIKGNNADYTDTSGLSKFTSTGQFNIQGNIMSLSYEDNFIGQTTFRGSMYQMYQFAYLFGGCVYLISAENLILPATNLKQGCYRSMFAGCTSLTTAPKLPATKLASNCYESMFLDCSSLTIAPELPATTVKNMAYGYMFKNCTSLNYIKCLATTIGYDSGTYTYATNDWVYDVSLTGTFVKDPNATWPTLYGCGIPSNWTVIDAA